MTSPHSCTICDAYYAFTGVIHTCSVLIFHKNINFANLLQIFWKQVPVHLLSPALLQSLPSFPALGVYSHNQAELRVLQNSVKNGLPIVPCVHTLKKEMMS